MSKTTQENPAVENSATETVSNTSKSTPRRTKSTGTTTQSVNNTTKTTRTRTERQLVVKALLLLNKRNHLKLNTCCSTGSNYESKHCSPRGYYRW